MITVVTNETKYVETSKPFPKLMATNSGYLVFFSSDKVGVCLQKPPKAIDKIGEYSSEWIMDGFTDYNEPVTIQNK